MEEKALLEDTGKYLSFDVAIALSGPALPLFLLEFLLGCQWLGCIFQEASSQRRCSCTFPNTKSRLLSLSSDKVCCSFFSNTV